ncbi:MAG TPA: hypothetical protein VJ385_11000, partial [Fibrobacteria bacterium]|nr:hypothetical protein [Fibrobacteria bacterium]
MFAGMGKWPYLLAFLALTDCAVERLSGNPVAGNSGRRSKVKIPSRDATPPLAALDAIGRDTTWLLRTGQDPEVVSLSPDDSLVLVAVGEDRDGGIKDLSLTGNAVVKCKDPRDGRASSRTTGFLRRHVSGAVPARRADVRSSSRFVLRAGDFAALCPGGGITGLVGQATVRALNFHGGHATSPRLEFRL